MCRLFGMTAGNAQVHATYWLETAPDSMATQSHRNPDGTGIGWFDIAGDPHLTKQAEPAADDPRFQAEATAVDATTIVTHVRAATTGRNSVVNTHPFLIEDRIMAHNGGFSDLATVNEQLGDCLRFVKGDTDSERYAALIAQQTDLNGGDVGEGLAAAARWLSESVPMYSLNTIVATAGNLWALRYPAQRALHIATRTIDPGTGDERVRTDWHGVSRIAHHLLQTQTTVRVVVIASERIDGRDDWRMLDPGELVHVGPDLVVTSTKALDHAPKQFHLPASTDPNYDGF